VAGRAFARRCLNRYVAKTDYAGTDMCSDAAGCKRQRKQTDDYNVIDTNQ